MINRKKCLECHEAFTGRSDKKFCSDICRNAYNNGLYSNDNKLIRNTNRILVRNRRILMELNPNGESLVEKIRLYERGFSFHHFTSCIRTKEGESYFYCYDQGYIASGMHHYFLVRREDHDVISDEVAFAVQPFAQP